MKHGDFLWFDLMTTDTKAAAAFYGAVVGWQVQDSGQPGMDYALLMVEGQGAGGIMPIPAEAAGHPPAWSAYVAVDDVDAAARKVESLGGTVLREPWDVPGVIRLALVADPQGAGFLLGKGLAEGAMPGFAPRTKGAAGWYELMAGDGAAVFAFYEALFGWTKAEGFDMGEMGVYQLFAHGGPPIGGMMTKPPQVPAPHWNIYFNVDSAAAAVERVKAGAGQVLMGPHQTPTGEWIVQGQDPQGAYFSLLSDKA